MNKRVFGLFVLGLFAIVMVSGFASAGFFGNIFGKITGHAVAGSGCTDSDNGMDYSVKGTVANSLGSWSDFCVSNTLYELVCDDAGQKVQVAYNCPTGQACSDGACKSSGGGGGGGCGAQCTGKQCGSDGCGGSCGTCASGQICDASGVCKSQTCKQMGDVNNDCVINALDLQIVTSNFGKTTSTGDVNGDGVVNAIDLQAVNSNFGKACPGCGCTPQCTGKQCGVDGCGGTCGTCPSGQICDVAGQCAVIVTPTCRSLGDVNNDCVINGFDMQIVYSHFGQTTSEGDTNDDGVVNGFDLQAVNNNYGKTCSGCTPIVPPTCRQRGDVNNDCVINALDVQIVKNNYGKTTSVGDTNDDGVVNAIDVQAVNSNFGKACSGCSGGSTCTDSDGGLIYYTLGKLTVTSCSGASCNTDFVKDLCNNSNTLLEGYCNGTLGKQLRHTCPNGCADGACKSSGLCTDSDGGLNYNVKGYLLLNSSGRILTIPDECCVGNYTASCVGYPNRLQELFCDGDLTRVDFHDCPNGCADGACISEGNYVKTCDSTVALDLTNSGTTLAFSWDDGASTGFKVLKLTVVTSDGYNRTTIIDKATGMTLCEGKRAGDTCIIMDGSMTIVDVYSRSNGEKGVVLRVGTGSNFNDLGVCSLTCKQRGDVNSDCVINALDVQIVQSNFGKTTSSGDTNGDGVVNAFDLQAVNSNYGKTCSGCSGGSCKDSVKLERAADRLEIGEALSAVFGSSTVTKDNLKLFLAGGSYKVKDQVYKYEQTITLGSALTLQSFSDLDYNNGVPTVGIKVVPNTAILNYTLAFPLGVKSSIGTGANCAVGHLCDIEGTAMHMLGADYSVLSATLSYLKLQKLSGGMEIVEINSTAQSVKVNGIIVDSLIGLLIVPVQSGGKSAKLDKLILQWKSTDKLFLAAETPLSMPLNAIGFSMILVKGDPSADAVVSLYGVLPSEYCGGGGGVSPTCKQMGDVNSDCVINVLDVQIVKNNYGKTTSVGDTNDDGVVNAIDVQAVNSNFGKACEGCVSIGNPRPGFFARTWARITGRAI